MRRSVLAVLVPPLAVCRYGCASCCAAPIGVFWVTGIVGLIYAFYGGPLQASGLSWGTLALGAGLWAIATVWAITTIRSVEQDTKDPECVQKSSTMCRVVRPRLDESDPFDVIGKAP